MFGFVLQPQRPLAYTQNAIQGDFVAKKMEIHHQLIVQDYFIQQFYILQEKI